MLLEIGVQPAAGHIAQINGGRANPADVLAVLKSPLQAPEGAGHILPAARGGADGNQGVAQAPGPADVDGLAVQKSPLALAGGEHLSGVGVIDHRHPRLSLGHQGQGDGAVLEFVDQVGGAVHRVQHPDRRLKIPVKGGLFLGQKADVRAERPQPPFQKGLDRGVRHGHIVCGGLGADLLREGSVV